ncbi:WG repeat-containing protein, partial [Arthrospira platensis SPKY2]
MAVPADFDDALLRFSRDRTVVLHGDRAALVDSAGRIVADLGAWPWPELGEDDFDDVATYVGFEDFFADGLMPWLHEGRWGYIDLDGHWAIPAQYDQAQFFRGGRAGVQAGARGLVIDTKGKTL